MDSSSGRQWSPPSVWAQRRHVYIAMAILGALAMYLVAVGDIRLGRQTYGSFNSALDAPDVESVPTMPPEFSEQSLATLEQRALGEGYVVHQPLTAMALSTQAIGEVQVSVDAGASYVVMARSDSGCDIDLFLNEEVLDTASTHDAAISWDAAEAGVADIKIRAGSSERDTCDISYLVYRR